MTTNLQMATSVQVIRMLGAQGVEANLGAKSPTTGWQPSAHTPQQSEIAIQAALDGKANLGIHLAGSIIDVDVDNDDPLLGPALDAFLPYSSHVWGRPSRPRTHRLYKANDDFDPTLHTRLLGYIKKQHGVEMRGGAASRGNYSLMAGSVHPSGEQYEWADIGAARSTPTLVKVDALIAAVRKAVAASYLAKYWVEGVRNDLCMALTGALYRVYSLSFDDDGNQIGWAMPKDEALDFVLKVAELADDDPADRPARAKTARQTWDKGEAGLPITGAKRFADLAGDDGVTAIIYNLLSDSPDAAKLEEFLARFAIRSNSGDVVDLDALANGSIRKALMSDRAFRQSYGYIRVSVGAKSYSATDLLFKLPMAQRVDGLDIKPNKPNIYTDNNGETLANTWSGFRIAPHPTPVTEEEIRPFIFHVRNIIADNDAAHAHWIMSWIADIFKHPDTRCGTALVLVGNPGSGKSSLGHWVLNKIIGAKHSIVSNDLNQMSGGFNAMYADKLFTQADEALNQRQHALAAKLKALITDETMRVELKGVDSWTQRNISRYLFTSNDRDAIHIVDGAADRRYAVFETSNKYCHDLDMWISYKEWLTPDNLAKIHRYLIDYTYDRVLISRPPQTRAKSEMIAHSVPTLVGWLGDVIDNRHPLTPKTFTQPWHAARLTDDTRDLRDMVDINFAVWPTHVAISALYDSYIEHCKRAGVKPQHNSTQSFATAIRKTFPRASSEKTRVHVWHVDPRTGVRAQMRTMMTGFPSLRDIHEYIGAFTAMEPMLEEEDSDEILPDTPY